MFGLIQSHGLIADTPKDLAFSLLGGTLVGLHWETISGLLRAYELHLQGEGYNIHLQWLAEQVYMVEITEGSWCRL